MAEAVGSGPTRNTILCCYSLVGKARTVKNSVKFYSCIVCNKECRYDPHRKANKFCSNQCQRTLTKTETLRKIQNGEIKDRGTLRRALIRKFGHACQSCELTEWMKHPIPLEIDHIDGNAGNNILSNLRLLCCNCNGITPTWKGRNKGSGRAARGLSLL